jgi:hypothetical protein
MMTLARLTAITMLLGCSTVLAAEILDKDQVRKCFRQHGSSGGTLGQGPGEKMFSAARF